MSPEELQTCRDLLEMLQDENGEVAEYWRMMLAHIEDQEANIASFKGELEIAGQRLREMSLKKDEFALMRALETCKEQIEALKEMLIFERAKYIHQRDRKAKFGSLLHELDKEKYYTEARQQLADEMPEWNGNDGRRNRLAGS